MAKTLTPEERAEAEALLAEMKTAQTELWDASLALEKLLGFDVDTTQDLQDVDLDEMIAIKGEDTAEDRTRIGNTPEVGTDDDDRDCVSRACSHGDCEDCPDNMANCCDCSCHRGGR